MLLKKFWARERILDLNLIKLEQEASGSRYYTYFFPGQKGPTEECCVAFETECEIYISKLEVELDYW